MKRHWIPVAMLLCLCAQGRAQTLRDATLRDDVKTVQLYREGSELEAPLLVMGEQARMVLEFDVLGTTPEHLQWRIAHCNRQWEADDLEPNEFMTGFEGGPVEGYDFSFTTLRDYVHYQTTVPGAYAEFLHSGNYVLTVHPDGQPDSLLLVRRFCVSEQAMKVEATVTRPYDGIDLDRRQELDLRLTPRQPQQGDPQRLTVVAQQNGRLDSRRTLEFSGYEGAALTYRHRQCNLFFGGNTFRFFDCSNLRSPMYNVQRVEDYGGETFAILRPDEDRSRKHYLSETTLNGGMKVNIWDRTNPRLEADYVWVNFSLPMEQPLLDGGVYIVGALTDWRLDTLSQMEYNPRFRAYTKRLLLKQGYYAYQLLVARPTPQPGPAPSLTARLEGDHRETPNRYTIYVYYRDPSDRADRLLAVQQAAR